MLSLRGYIIIYCCMVWILTFAGQSLVQAQSLSPSLSRAFSILLPDQPTREHDSGDTPLDVLFALADPFTLAGADIDMPQMLAVLRTPPAIHGDSTHTNGKNKPTAQREELLGSVEEIRYADKKAWATHVRVDTPGLYTLIAESRPQWDEAQSRFTQHFIKTILPVKGVENGWSNPAQMKFEIVPSTRPFGLMAPALFTGKVLLDNVPVPACTVYITRMNTEKRGLPTEWHTVQVVRTDHTGAFAFVCPLPGWWAFMGVTLGDPLKGPDGNITPLEMGAVLWVHVDDSKANTFKPVRSKKN